MRVITNRVMAEEALNIDALSVDELREELRKLNLQISGSKAVLRDRLRTAIREAESSANNENEKKLSDENSEDDEEGDSDSDNEENEATGRVSATRLPLSFKDVEDSLQTFSGDGKRNVRKWIEEFEETCEVCQWTEAQKIIYAKKLLRGSAKLFVSYEKCATSWKKLKKSLIKEFAKTANSKSVHKELACAKKQSDESFHEYMYRMMEIASHADIELEAKIQYIIEGIPDEPLNKSILYGAQSISDLRKRLTQYGTMKNNQKSTQKNQSTKPGKEMRREGARVPDKPVDAKRCHNCGDRNHKAADCPSKDKGTKCFQCREFGHIAANCGKRADAKQVNACNVAVKYDKKIYKI